MCRCYVLDSGSARFKLFHVVHDGARDKRVDGVLSRDFALTFHLQTELDP